MATTTAITITAFLALILVGMINALAVPRPDKSLEIHKLGAQDLVKRNITVGTQQLDLNIDPDIVNPNCGGVYLANINVQFAPDPFYLTAACNKVLSYIGGPKGNKDVDVVFACLAQPTSGSGDRDIKVILNTQANFVLDGSQSGTQNIPANMEITSENDNFFLSTSVDIGVKVNSGAGKVTFQYIYC
ncbi:hypothetical protein A1O3_00617 [Capronia epimyces CBS 606.96]|uniref:Uncharacterized protein n=1 Tax=Capronia epimyces CBS 606.96 TaxID=1182542 RepID=W9YGP5_9EURO|nr:uncharacterized protein A1O3_00617 [Capronia epimyces CBS 606.96]EXJ92067.1 hypothetical protein A1O3_00617 [Capronia epimyces CBS 606.96]